MRIVLREWAKCPKSIISGIVLTVLRIVQSTINIRLMKVAADTLNMISTNQWQPLLTIFIVMLISSTILAYITTTLESYTDHVLYTTLMGMYANKMLDADYDMFLKISCSRIITAEEQIVKMKQIREYVTDIIICISRLIVTIITINEICPEIMVPTIIIYTIGTVIMAHVFKSWDKLGKTRGELVAKRNQEVDETINGFVEVRSFCTRERHRESLHSQNMSLFNLFMKKAYSNAALNLLISVISDIAVIITVLISADSIIAGTLTIPSAIIIISYDWDLIDPLAYVLSMINKLTECLTQINDYDKVVSYKNSVVDTGHIELTEFNNSIEFQDVDFKYGDSNAVLEGLNLKIPKGKKIGICGVSGGGKSTILKLIEKFYVPTGGRILIDGIDITDIRTDSIRSKIGVVHQDNHIFNTTIRENIIYGSWDATESEIIDACKKANIYNFIQTLPNKMNTEIGPKGLKLSGGQRQRIALARIFLANPDIILLDEATSALDNESETLIQDALNMFEDKTIVTIAHRLSTIKNSDIIYVIQDHKVVESGTHEELIASGGVYAALSK